MDAVPVPQQQIDQLQRLIDQSKAMVFFGGAGTSTESGLRDFRGENGAYGAPSPIPLATVYSHDFFYQHPDEFYRIYRQEIRCPTARPGPAHKKLAELERAGRLRAIVTQNTDNLHQDAGSRNVIELHGSAYRNYCTACGAEYDIGYMIDARGTPRCRLCGGVIRPDVVLYQEAPRPQVLEAARAAVAGADFLLVGGSSLVVYPAAGLLNDFTGAHLAIINRTPTRFDSRAELVIRGSIGQVLSRIEVHPCAMKP